MTALLTGIVLVLIICHTPKTIINVYESYQVRVWDSWERNKCLRFSPLDDCVWISQIQTILEQVKTFN